MKHPRKRQETLKNVPNVDGGLAGSGAFGLNSSSDSPGSSKRAPPRGGAFCVWRQDGWELRANQSARQGASYETVIVWTTFFSLPSLSVAIAITGIPGLGYATA